MAEDPPPHPVAGAVRPSPDRPDVSADDDDLGWGERPDPDSDRDDAWYRGERPPHHD